MARDWETTFRSWTGPSSDTEQEKADNAARMIRDAIRESRKLAARTIEVFPQGSYRNNTNVRQDSDVDVCVRCMDSFFYELPADGSMTIPSAGIVAASYHYSEFKNDVEDALVAKFGRRGVTRGSKAFDIHENTYRMDADAVACFEHRRYTHVDRYGRAHYLSGTEFLPDEGWKVINWPHQHYDNGVAKNTATGRRFKSIVRVLKRLRNEMKAADIAAAGPIPSYLVECLVWNVPNNRFGQPTYVEEMRTILAFTINGTSDDESCREWGEVNELKYLFRPSQPWTRQQALDFLLAAWIYVGY